MIITNYDIIIILLLLIELLKLYLSLDIYMSGYSNSQINAFLDTKQDKSVSYNASQIDNLLSQKQKTIGEDDLSVSMISGLQDVLNSTANTLPSTNAVSIQQVSNLESSLNTKSNKTETYTIAQVDGIISSFQTNVNQSIGNKVDTNQVYKNNEVDTQMGMKQNVITNNSFTNCPCVDT